MRCFHTTLVGASFVILSAASLSAQTPVQPDSTKVARLATVTVTADEGNWFTRADDKRRGILFLMAENRRLSAELRRHDEKVAALQVRLDSLKQVETEKQAAIATIGDSLAATRARRRALEARVLAAEVRQPER
jgi:hypothetical protein